MPQPRRVPQSEIERQGFDIGQKGLAGALAKYGPGVAGDYARSAGRGLLRAARPVARGAAFLSGDPTALIPEIGVEPDEPIGDYARGLGMLEPTPQPVRPAPTPTGPKGMTPGGRGWQLIEGRARIPEIGQVDDEAARAGVRSRATVPREVGPIDPLSLSASQIEADFGAQEMLNARHRRRLESIDLDDPYLRAREAERQGLEIGAGAEDLALTPTDEAPDTTMYKEGGVYKNRREPRFTGGEYKKQLGQQTAAELQIARAAVPEQMKAQAGEARRKAFYDQAVREIEDDAQQQTQQLQSELQGDQLKLALQKLSVSTAAARRKALIDSFALDARFNVRNDGGYPGPQ